MYKNLVILICIIFLCCSSNVFKQNKDNFKQDSDEILWSSERKLIWNDFAGVPDTSQTNLAALTSAEIEITQNWGENDIPKYVLQCHFIKSQSWTKVHDELTLLHEQLHFDIGELFTRKIRRSFDSLNAKKVKDYLIYEKVFFSYVEKNESFQKKYDSEVNFNDVSQLKWAKKISAELLKLKKYEYIPKE